jgi:outer membrane protein OmpA-like peptidoglycan-associated protein
MSDVASTVKSKSIYPFVFLVLSFSAGLLLAYSRGPQTLPAEPPPTQPLVTEPLVTETRVDPDVGASESAIATPVGMDARAETDALDTRLSDAEAKIQHLERELVAVAEQQTAVALVVEAQQDRLAEMLADTDTGVAAASDSAAADAISSASPLQDDLVRLGARPTERGYLVTLTESELRFPVGGSALSSERPESLGAIAEVLARHEQLSARVEGHTDRSGSAAKNLALSRERAQSVKGALAAMGIDAERIEIFGIGEAQPIDESGTAEARQRNRRVEVYLIER